MAKPLVVLGPDSLAWRYAGDITFTLVIARPLLLQVGHPTIAAAVAEHSRLFTAPWGRLRDSVDYFNRTVYGPDQAAVAAEVRELHRDIKGIGLDGRRYHAWEPEPFGWVNATEFETFVRIAELFGHALTEGEQSQMWDEWRQIGRNRGLRDRDMPADLASFRDYYDDMLTQRLRDSDTVQHVLRQIKNPPPPKAWLEGPMWRAATQQPGELSWLLGVGTLPPVVRERFNIDWTDRNERQLARRIAVIRRILAVTPSAIRNPQAARASKRWSS